MNLVFGVFDSSEAAARGIERLLNRGCTETRAPADKHPIIINIVEIITRMRISIYSYIHHATCMHM